MFATRSGKSADTDMALSKLFRFVIKYNLGISVIESGRLFWMCRFFFKSKKVVFKIQLEVFMVQDL
jgi:hypothetical protein